LLGLERIALAHGLSGRRLLDVACGTGKSFLPLFRRGYDVTACDISQAMVTRARAKVGDSARVFAADMRSLPRVGTFDLVTCLDDAVNYLVSDAELRSAFDGIARNMRRGGLLLFDVNTLATYRAAFARDAAADGERTFFCWRGGGSGEAGPGVHASAWVEVFEEVGGGLWRRTRTEHRQRHHPRAVIERALADARLELVAVHGQAAGARIDPSFDEDTHPKAVYVARR
jgi:SAM-dependent methyltransferase